MANKHFYRYQAISWNKSPAQHFHGFFFFFLVGEKNCMKRIESAWKRMLLTSNPSSNWFLGGYKMIVANVFLSFLSCLQNDKQTLTIFIFFLSKYSTISKCLLYVTFPFSLWPLLVSHDKRSLKLMHLIYNSQISSTNSLSN